MSEIYNIPASVCFVETLAAKLLEDYKDCEFKLAETLVLLPNRRACRSLAEAFVHQKGMDPTILPQMRAIGDTQEDELILNGSGAAEEFLSLPPAISPLERTLLFMKLILRRRNEFGLQEISLSQSCRLAIELGNLLDKARMQNLDWNNLASLAPEEYATHWQETLKFLKIITHYWPEILTERGVIDANDRKDRLIEKQCLIWHRNPPSNRIIIAGTTAVSPVMKLLVKTVLELPKGEIYLAGLDTCLEDDAWNQIDESHPQFEFKQLLDYLQLNRHQIKPLIAPRCSLREKFISEIMRPATCSHRWRQIEGNLNIKAVEGIRLIECTDARTEALTIAVLIRCALEKPEQTVALITPDRNLARRTAAELKRWKINVDDSAGIPLAQTPWAIFMRLCIAAIEPDAGKEQLLALFKNPLFSAGMPKQTVAKLIKRLDKDIWRSNKKDPEIDAFLQKIRMLADDIITLFCTDKASLKDIITKHIMLAESFAATEEQSGAEILWQNEDGEAGAAFMADWLKYAPVLEEIKLEDYLSLFETMMTGTMVRSKRPNHPRVRILGPMEARLNHFDKIILGGLNEGIWPPAAEADPWMSRPMKHDFGFELPEKQIGVLGLDFANLLAAPSVCLTRAGMNGGAPTVKSRWWMRLETVLQAAGINKKALSENACQSFAAALDAPEKFIKIKAPSPTPPLIARPRKLSASSFERLLRDPYGIYAEYILKLKPLDKLDSEPTRADFGSLIHKILENFGRLYPDKLPDNAADILQQIGQKLLAEQNLSKEKQAFWLPNLTKIINWLIQTELQYRPEIKRIHTEIRGSVFFDNLPNGRFEISAIADRVDETKDGRLNILDYKTGQARSSKEVQGGYAPQLPIEGLIAVSGGFSGIKAAEVGKLIYWQLGTKTTVIDQNLPDIFERTQKQILKTISLFDSVSTGYLSRPNPKHIEKYSDYEHLARISEWSVQEEEEDE